MELEALQTYGRCTTRYAEELRPIEDYRRDCVELVTALKESAVARVAASLNLSKEDESSSGGDSKQKGSALLDKGAEMEGHVAFGLGHAGSIGGSRSSTSL